MSPMSSKEPTPPKKRSSMSNDLKARLLEIQARLLQIEAGQIPAEDAPAVCGKLAKDLSNLRWGLTSS
jgi:hypothetical protein